MQRFACARDAAADCKPQCRSGKRKRLLPILAAAHAVTVMLRAAWRYEMDCKWMAGALTGALILIAAGCGGDDGDTMNQVTAGTGASGFGAAGTGLAGAGAAGTGTTAPNMPDAACMAAAGPNSPACSACACTPNALGGCLDQVNACQNGADAMANMLCGAILTCARTNNCTGTGCVTPCMSQVVAGATYMGGAPTTAASAVGMCTSTSCAAVCPTGMMTMP